MKESRKKHYTVQIPPKSNPKSESGKQIQEHRSGRGYKELQMEVHNIVQEVGSKTISKKKKCKKAKWLSEEALRTARKRRDARGKGEKERYTQQNAACQRIARRDKKAFLSEQ